MLETIGYQPRMATWAAARDATLGRVIRVDQGVVVVLSERGPLRCTYGGRLLGKVAANPQHAPCAGDWCVVQEWPDHRLTVAEVLPRSSTVLRPAGPGSAAPRALCANADLVAVVVAARPAAPPATLRRLVALAQESGARPLVVLTTAAPATERVREDPFGAAAGLEVVHTSTGTEAGLGRLRELVDGHRTLALVGLRGHGKSALTDALVGAEVLPARPVRGGGGRSRTVRRELVPLPGGGAVIDTRGLTAAELSGEPAAPLAGPRRAHGVSRPPRAASGGPA